jgi:hypothetical protein
MANGGQVSPEEGSGVWYVAEGKVSTEGGLGTYRADGTENLTYNNPYGVEMERVWFDGKIVYAIDAGEVELDFDENRVALGTRWPRSTRSSTRWSSTSTAS